MCGAVDPAAHPAHSSPHTPSAAQTTCGFSTCSEPHEGPSSRNPCGRDTRMDPALQTPRLFQKHPRSSPPLCLQLCSWEAKVTAASALPGPTSWHPQSLTRRGRGAVSIPQHPALLPHCLCAVMLEPVPWWETSRFLLPAWGQREGGPQLMFQHLRGFSLNPASLRQSSAGSGKLFSPWHQQEQAPVCQSKAKRGCSQPGV